MPISLINKEYCRACGAIAKQKTKSVFGTEVLIELECGHISFTEILESRDYSSYESSDGKKLMPFQIAGLEFAARSDARCLIADEQGLGKTIQVDALLYFHPELLPAVLVTKSAIKIQHLFEARRWIKTDKIQVIFSSKEIAVPGMDLYITSYDMLKEENVWSYIEPKTLILDECQKIKNHLSGRAKAAQSFSQRCEHVIGLSGTPIMNHAGEYFTVLNMIEPKLFPEYARFVREHCDNYSNLYGTKVGGLSNPERFRELTKDIVIRRTLADVMPDIASMREPRKFFHCEKDKRTDKAYQKLLEELEELMYAEEANMAAKIAIMTRMRQITGVGKVEHCLDFVTEFLEGTDRKIAIFAHHHLAVDLLESKLNTVLKELELDSVVMLRAGDDSRAVLNQLSQPNARVLLASGLAAGEGMDGLQLICNDMIMLERQWNPAIEEQIESRLIRYGQTKPVNITYMIASETIDEYFTEIVERKRAIVSATMDGRTIEWESSNLMQELAEILVSKNKKKWTL